MKRLLLDSEGSELVELRMRFLIWNILSLMEALRHLAGNILLSTA